MIWLLLWSLLLLVLIHFHLVNRDNVLLSTWRDTLDTLSTLLPAQSEAIAESILKATGIVSTQQLVNQIRVIDKEVEDELKAAAEEPFIPPWEPQDINPTSVSKQGQWGIDE